MFAEGWVVFPRPLGSPEPTWHSALGASCQVGSGDPLVLGYTTQPSANILIFKINFLSSNKQALLFNVQFFHNTGGAYLHNAVVNVFFQ